MRKVLGRAFAPLGALLFVSGFASSASAGGVTGEARVVLRGNSPWLFVGGTYQGAPTNDPAARAKSVVSQRTALGSTLVATSIDRFGDGDVIVHMEQAHQGLPVIGRGAAVRLDAAGDPIVTAIDIEDNLPTSIVPSVSTTSAALVAGALSPVGAHRDDAHLVVWPMRSFGGARSARLAYAVVPRVPAGIPFSPRIIVDAQTGKVIEARDMLQFAKANMYTSNPTKSPQAAMLDFPIAPEGPNLSNPFVQSSNCIDNKTVKPIDALGFKINVHICDLVQVATADGAGDYNYPPADQAGSAESKKDEFSEVSMYYHSTKAYAFFRGLQGDPTAQVVVDKPLKVIANLQIPPGIATGNITAAGDPNKPLEPFSNAFFSPAGGQLGQLFQQLYGFNQGALWFGQGPSRDYAYDGDVVYHELGHAVVDKTLRLEAWHADALGVIDSPGGMNEGLADYFSSAITGDPDMGEYASKDISVAPVIRTLDNKDKCPTAIVGEVHYDSTLFSGALWQARKSLASDADRTKLDTALYKAMRTNAGRGDLGYEDLGKLFMTTLQTDFPAGATALDTAFKEHGIFPSCSRVLSFADGKAVKSPDSRIGFVAPGTQALGLPDLAPGIIQIKAALPEKTGKVTITFSSLSSLGGGGGNPLGGNATPFTPIVLAKVGKTITWDGKSKEGHDAELKGEVTGSGTRTASIDLPEGATGDLYIQIANKGESDGQYDSVALAFTPRVGEEPPPPVDPGPKPTTTTTESGCACNTPGSSGGNALPVGGILAGLGLLIGLGRRRRRA
jgi:hypothetical protein